MLRFKTLEEFRNEGFGNVRDLPDINRIGSRLNVLEALSGVSFSNLDLVGEFYFRNISGNWDTVYRNDEPHEVIKKWFNQDESHSRFSRDLIHIYIKDTSRFPTDVRERVDQFNIMGDTRFGNYPNDRQIRNVYNTYARYMFTIDNFMCVHNKIKGVEKGSIVLDKKTNTGVIVDSVYQDKEKNKFIFDGENYRNFNEFKLVDTKKIHKHL